VGGVLDTGVDKGGGVVDNGGSVVDNGHVVGADHGHVLAVSDDGLDERGGGVHSVDNGGGVDGVDNGGGVHGVDNGGGVDDGVVGPHHGGVADGHGGGVHGVDDGSGVHQGRAHNAGGGNGHKGGQDELKIQQQQIKTNVFFSV
jgi:hypothetical protein